MVTIALAGNPNTGKTSLFNALTGSYEYVGNWAGVTVEKKVGRLRAAGGGKLLDLPGMYSPNPLTTDEEVASRCLLDEPIDALLNVVDASQLKRNLLLTVQLLELGKPMVIALNMIDVAERRGVRVDAGKLSARLGAPVVPVVARSGKGCPEVAALLAGMDGGEPVNWRLDYGEIIERVLAEFERLLPDATALRMKESGRSVRWLGLQFLDGNRVAGQYLDERANLAELERIRQAAESQLAGEKNKPLSIGHPSIAHYLRHVRSEYIDGLMRDCLNSMPGKNTPLSEKVDRIVTNRWLGVPIFILFMYLTFMLTFDWLGSPLSGALDAFIAETVSEGIGSALSAIGASEFIRTLVLEGIVAGVGGVLVFVPQIFILFFILSYVEDSGYMARVAMVMDRLAESVGLSGKAFIPMVIGFGCNVPGVMAARTIDQPRERLLTILVTPLMSCSARLAVYSLFVGAFFVRYQAAIMLSLYLLGIVAAMGLAKLFSFFLMKKETSIFVLELPPYRYPQWRTLWRSTWEKGKGFVAKAGTFIFGGSVLIWLLGYFGIGGAHVEMEDSLLAAIGGFIAPLLEPLGFGTWQAAAALITGFFAKEVVVSTMNIIYASPDAGSLQLAVSQVFTPVQAYSFMTFLLLYIPCLATVAAIRKETMSARWTWFTIGYGLALAYGIALLINQAGGLLGH